LEHSSNNTISGETCYMVDKALYKDILLAVAVRNQNHQVLLSAAEQMKSHISQIEGSHERIAEREKSCIEGFVKTLTDTHHQLRVGHQTRMKKVMKDINALKASMESAAGQRDTTDEMQQLKHQVSRYESVLPVYAARLRDTESMNEKLNKKKHDLSKSIEQLKERLNRAESIVFSIATPEANKKQEPSRVLKKILGIPDVLKEPAVSTSDEHVNDGSEDSEQDASTVVDLANTSFSSADTAMEITSDQLTPVVGAEPRSEMTVREGEKSSRK
jgi:chromosome segregation ATPase